VFDAKTHLPIPFVNIGVVNKGIGTVVKENGEFALSLPIGISADDILKVSMLGYKPQTLTISELKANSNLDIFLEADPFELEEVVLNGLVAERKILGFEEITDKHVGYWKDKDGLGGELATRIRIKKKHSKLLKAKTNVFFNNADSILTRVNIYNYRKQFPQENIANTAIYRMITDVDSPIEIDLSPYNIIVDNDVVVSVELVKAFGDSIQAGIYGATRNSISFIRSVSQDAWKRHEGKGVAISLEVGQIKKEYYALSNERKEAESIRIFWDASRSLKNRDFEKEVELLKLYLRKNPNANTQILVFNNQVKDYLHYGRAKEIDFKGLLRKLRSIPHDGMSDYQNLEALEKKQVDNTLIFTDGNSFIGSLQREYDSSVFTISSTKEVNRNALQDLAIYNDGHYIDLNTTSLKEAEQYLLYDIEDLKVYAQERDTSSYIKGRVFLDNIPLTGGLVHISGTFVEEQTDKQGYFRIPAELGDVLNFEFFGATTQTYTITDDLPVEIFLKSEGDRLDEVVLSIKKDKARKNKKKVIHNAVFEVSAESINPNRTRLIDVLRETTSLRIENGGFVLFPRSYRSVGFNDDGLPSYLFNGVIYEQGRLPYINPAEIASISIINPRSALNYYSVGGGLIVIRTKDYQKTFETSVKQQNDITELNQKSISAYEISFSTHQAVQNLYDAGSLNEALHIYHTQLNNFQNVLYFIEAGEVFSKWDKNIAASVMSNALALANKNTRVLKIVASYFEQYGKSEQAEHVYARIVTLLPSSKAALRDLSMITEINGNYLNAYEGYKYLAFSMQSNSEVTALNPIVKNEFNRLLTIHKDVIWEYDKNQYFKNPAEGMDLRIVLSWMPTLIDVELDFVSPNGEIFKWELKNRKGKISNSPEAVEEFVLEDAPKGEWIINMKYNERNKEFQLPPYMKLSVYKNFAKSNEQKEIRILKLLNQGKLTTIEKIVL